MPKKNQAKPRLRSVDKVIIIVASVAAVTIMVGLVATSIFSAEKMYIIRPLLVTGAVFIIFSSLLSLRVGTNIFGEIGFIYLVLALAYTILPAITLFVTEYDIPLGYDGSKFVVLMPQPEELGTQFWRHALFISGVAVGYLALRGGALPQKSLNKNPKSRNKLLIAVIITGVSCCIIAVTLLSSPVTTYHEYYTRFDHLSWFLKRFAYMCVIFKSGGYFVLMALLFSDYRRYRMLIFIVVPILCAYETLYSLGSRIEALTILLAFVVFYNFRVTSISIKKGIIYLVALALLFSAVELVRSAQINLESIQDVVATEEIKFASEFNSVFTTGFHLYDERAAETLPPRDWQMFFYEFISLIPFVDHEIYQPNYWYARNYFPTAEVPPQSMGVIADSAIWGGEFDLLIRSLLNGAIFALLTCWFFHRREKWWALTIYVYCCATCILTLKYSVLYQLIPLVRIILPTLLLTGALFRLQKAATYLKSVSNKLK